ncbi:MAG: ABC transporter substrate-binding protein [Chloroflexota bacterium]
MDASFPPLETVAPNGTIVGIDPTLTQAIAADLRVKARILNIPSDGLKNALLAGKADAIISSFIPVREWSRELGYSRAYYNAGPVLVAAAESASSGLIGVARDTPDERAARARWATRLRLFETPDAALSALAAGRISGAVVDAPDLTLFAQQTRETALHVQGKTLASVPYVVVVKKRDAALLAAIDQAISRLRANGTLAGIDQLEAAAG